LLLSIAAFCLCHGMRPLMQDTPEDVPHDQCGVTAILSEDEVIYLFSLGQDNGIYYRSQNLDGTFGAWIGLGGNFSTGVQPVRNIDGNIEIFGIGNDDQLYHSFQDIFGVFQPWIALGGPFSGSPSTLLNSEGNIALFARGKVSRSLMYNHQVRNSTAVFWVGWSNLGGILTSGPSAVLTAEAMVHVFVRGVDKGLFEKTQVATHTGTVAWSRYEGLGGLLASQPAVPATLNPVNLLEVFVRQADRAIWYKRQVAITHEADSVTWTDWETLGGKMSSGPSVIVDYDGLLEVFVRGMNREIFTKRQIDHDTNDFFVWESLGGDSASTPFTLLTPAGSLHIFLRGSNEKIHHKIKTPISPGAYEWSEWQILDANSTVSFQLYPC